MYIYLDIPPLRCVIKHCNTKRIQEEQRSYYSYNYQVLLYSLQICQYSYTGKQIEDISRDKIIDIDN